MRPWRGKCLMKVFMSYINILYYILYMIYYILYTIYDILYVIYYILYMIYDIYHSWKGVFVDSLSRIGRFCLCVCHVFLNFLWTKLWGLSLLSWTVVCVPIGLWVGGEGRISIGCLVYSQTFVILFWFSCKTFGR